MLLRQGPASPVLQVLDGGLAAKHGTGFDVQKERYPAALLGPNGVRDQQFLVVGLFVHLVPCQSHVQRVLHLFYGRFNLGREWACVPVEKLQVGIRFAVRHCQ